ncbi:MAG: XdhC family protein [Woeseia sp.]
MSPRHLLHAFERWRSANAKLVLATVYETEGSTYSKSGAQMLIDAEGNFQGMLSGGCLEGDLAERATEVLTTGTPQQVSYDLGSNDEELWGLGVGCDGLMRIFLQPLTSEDNYQPFAAMADVYGSMHLGAAATVLSSSTTDFQPGMAVVVSEANALDENGGALQKAWLHKGIRNVLRTRRSYCQKLDFGGNTVDVLFACLRPPPNVLVLGAGLDAEPVVRLISDLGWRVTVQDHRPAYIEKGNFESADRIMNGAASELFCELDISHYDAAIVMSHHLQTDRCYLELLADSTLAYIGLLGPRERRRRLLHDLGDAGAKLAGRVHGPAGLNIGGRGPASIALSIVAEMHQVLMQDDV